jgi:hypothetical protein
MFSFLKQADKQGHFYVGCIIAFTAALFIPVLYALLLTVVVGIAKEVWDSFGNGCVEFLDGVATALGGLYVTLLYIIQWVI